MGEMSREKALEVMNILRFGTFEEIINTHEIVNDALDAAIEALKKRPHGEWKVDKKIYCSECGESICDFIPNPTDAVGLILSNNFCPNCGADMREGEAE